MEEKKDKDASATDASPQPKDAAAGDASKDGAAKDNASAQGSPPGTDEGDINSLEQLSEGNDKTPTDGAAQAPADTEKPKPPKKKGFKRVLGFFNVYLLIFILLLLVGGAVFGVYYLNSKKVPPTPKIAVEDLSQQTLSQVASEGQASVGNPDLLLNIQSNTIFNGQILAKGDVNIAGDLKLGKELAVPSLTVSGQSNLGTVQVNQLAVANSMVVQGALTIQQGLNVGAGASFNGGVTASKITTSNLILSGTGALTLNNHIIANGPSPSHSTGSSVGSGGSASASGSDTAGKVNINTGQGTTVGCLITVTFSQKYDSAPSISLTPTSAGAGLTAYYATTTTTGFSVCAAQSPPTGSTLDFNYFIVQ